MHRSEKLSANNTNDKRPRHLAVAEPALEPALRTSRRSRKQKPADLFFDGARPHSIVKSDIVTNYFVSWSCVMKRQTRSGKLAYLDLYAGRGKYKDGSDSTPLRLLKYAISDPEIANGLLAFFGHKDPECAAELRKNIDAIPDIEKLRYKPSVSIGAADEHGFAETFRSKQVVPTFMFLDPFGYHGLSTKLMRSILKDFGCDLLFFFKYTRIRAALRNDRVRRLMDDIFGHERVEQLSARLPAIKSQDDKEREILARLEDALIDIGAKYVLTFRFLDENGHTTHHLVFVTKGDLGYDIMKVVMANASTGKKRDVGTFTYRPNDLESAPLALPLFGDGNDPVEALKADLLEKFRGRTLLIKDVYREHSYRTPYIAKNYQQALCELFWDEQKISAEREGMHPPLKRGRYPMPFDYTIITFDKA